MSEEEKATDFEGGGTETVKKARPRKMDERRRFLIRVIQLIRYTFRGYFGESFADKWGFFVDRNMSTEIHSYLDWIEYPKGNHVLEGHSNQVNCAVITRDGCYLFTGSEDSEVIKWDIRVNAMIFKLKAHSSYVLALAHSRGRLISAGEEGTIKVWDSDDGSLLRTMDGHRKAVWSLSLNQRGTTMVSCSTDRTCRVWSLKSGECLRVIIGHSDEILAAVWIGDSVVSASWDQTIRVWNADSGREETKITDAISEDVTDISLNCDSSMLVCSYYDGLTLFKWPSMEVFQKIREVNSMRVCFHPSIPNILALNDIRREDTIQIYRTDTSEFVHSFKGYSQDIFALQFTPDGTRLISGSNDKTVRIWDMSELFC